MHIRHLNYKQHQNQNLIRQFWPLLLSKQLIALSKLNLNICVIAKN